MRTLVALRLIQDSGRGWHILVLHAITRTATISPALSLRPLVAALLLPIAALAVAPAVVVDPPTTPLSPEESLKTFQIEGGYRLEVVLSEQRAPNPRFAQEEQKMLNAGGEAFASLCAACHGPDAKGAAMAGAPDGTLMAPPLALSQTVNGHRDGPINVLLHSLTGPIDGKT